MENKEIIVNSLNNVLDLINNSFLLLKEADRLLSEAGFAPVFGNTIGCEPSKSIHQSLNQFGNFLPQYLSRAYCHSENSANGTDNKVLFINIQLYHSNLPSLTPSMLAGVFTSQQHESVAKTNIGHWWLKYAAYEAPGMRFKLDGQQYRTKPFEEDSTEVVLWGKDILAINSVEDLKQAFTDPLIEMYYHS